MMSWSGQCGMLASLAPRTVRVSEAPSHGKPVLLYDLECAGSLAYAYLAREVLAREAEISRMSADQ
ncbi:MAG: hypothetical protein OXD42_13480, partial [Rhodospirillaceae bacterium]|nr:hypothetical protein [Rhodospirillaceae bacterium]